MVCRVDISILTLLCYPSVTLVFDWYASVSSCIAMTSFMSYITSSALAFTRTTASVPDIYIRPLTGKPKQQRFTMRSGVLTSISSRQHSAISGLNERP